MTQRNASKRLFKKESDQTKFIQLCDLLNKAEQRWRESGVDKHIEDNAKAAYRCIADEIREHCKNVGFRVTVPDILRGRGLKYISFHPEKGRSIRVPF